MFLFVSLPRCIAGIALFSSAFLSAQTVLNSGVPGENSAEVLKRTPSVLQTNKPTLVVVFAGMNDAANDKKLVSPEQTAANVLAIVQDVEAADAVPILVTVHAPDETRLMARHDPKVYGDRLPSQRVPLSEAC
jgi:lysophospholipase L1-like esterase